MKVICAVIAALLAALYLQTPALLSDADATAFYARAETRAAYFYSAKNASSALFTIPYTYCVQVLGEDGEWYYVKYADDYGIYRALYGYCLKDTLTVVSGMPTPVYLYKEVNVTYSADASDSSLPVLSELTVTAAFYGTYYSGPTAYSYVLCSGSFGYIEGANDDYELVDYAADEDTDDDSDDSGENSESVDGKIIAGAAIGAIAVTCLLVMLLGGKRRKFGG